MASDNVAKLNVVPVDRSGSPQANVIKFIEGLLARARTGELQSIAVAYVRANGYAANGVSWGERGTDCYPMATGLICAMHEYAVDMEKTSVDSAPPPEMPAPEGA